MRAVKTTLHKRGLEQNAIDFGASDSLVQNVDNELPKLPEVVDADDGLKLWLALFKAETEEDLAKIEAMEAYVMTEAIEAYRHVAATDEFREIERLRSRARHNEASALRHARFEGEQKGRIESVMTVLKIRFGEIHASLHAKLLGVQDAGSTEATLKLAATCRSLTEFQKALQHPALQFAGHHDTYRPWFRFLNIYPAHGS